MYQHQQFYSRKGASIITSESSQVDATGIGSDAGINPDMKSVEADFSFNNKEESKEDG